MTLEQIKSYLRAHTGYLKWGSRKLAERIGANPHEVLEAQQTIKDELRGTNDSTSVNTHGREYAHDEQTFRQDEDEKELVYDDFLKERGIDPSNIVSVKHWQTMNGEPRFSVVTKTDRDVEFDLEEAIKKALDGHITPVVLPPGPEATTDRVGILSLFDAHIDKIAIPSEIYGVKGMDLNESFALLERKFDEALEALALDNVDTIYFPVGSDFWSTNGPRQGTKKGTPQRTLVPHEESFERGVDFYLSCIEKLAQVTKTVNVITLKGNHDEDPVFYLGVVLAQMYKDNPRVIVHAARHQRKYFQEGEWGFGFGHGDKAKRKMDRLPLFFAQEAPHLWAATRMREMFFGDLHHTKEYKFQRARDGVGLYCYFLRSTNEADLWHSDEGWIGIPKSIYAFVYDRNGGRKKNITISW